jgi:hypothetical protein
MHGKACPGFRGRSIRATRYLANSEPSFAAVSTIQAR